MRVHLIIKGRVQGVFYMANTEKKALEMNLKGWVRNLSDGNVEVVAEGPRHKLEELIAWCWKGSPAANVEDIEAEWEENQNEYEDFKIKY